MSIFTEGDLIVETMGNPVWWCCGSRPELLCRGAVSWQGEGASQGFCCTQGRWCLRCGVWAVSGLVPSVGRHWTRGGATWGGWQVSLAAAELSTGLRALTCTLRSELSSPSSQHQHLVLPLLGEDAATSRRRTSQNSWLPVRASGNWTMENWAWGCRNNYCWWFTMWWWIKGILFPVNILRLYKLLWPLDYGFQR